MRTHRLTVTALACAVVLGGGLVFASAPALAVKRHIPLSFSPFGSFSEATRLAVDQANGNVFVADSGSNDIRVFDAEGGAPTGGIPAELTGAQTPAGSFSFTVRGRAPGIVVDSACHQHGLSGASCASFDPSNGDIYVSDVNDNVVDKFRVNGSNEYEYVCQFTGFGFVGTACLKNEPSVQGSPTEATFGEPDGVTVDREGNVYISDPVNKVIYEFNSAGEGIRVMQVTYLNSFGETTLERPADTAVDSSRRHLRPGRRTGSGGLQAQA